MEHDSSILTTVRLVWHGPYPTPEDLPDVSGLYAVTGRVYGDQNVHLLYIGLARETISQRWKDTQHRTWLSHSVPIFGGGLHYCSADRDLLNDLETALIYSHQPRQNSSKLNRGMPDRRFIIHNTRDVPIGMLPIVDTAYPWFDYVDTDLPH